MSDDGFAELAARSERVRNEHRLLLEGLRSFERKLRDLVGGLSCSGVSENVTFDEYFDHEGEIIGHIHGVLSFDGKELWVSFKEEPHPGYEESRWEYKSIEKIGADWQRKVSDQKVLDSLVACLLLSLDAEFAKTAPVVKSLAQFMTIEKAEIDSDLDELFSSSQELSDSWLKARKLVLADPDLSISLSCLHIETVLKGCLKGLGEKEYETYAVDKLMKRLLGVLRRASLISPAISEMLQGVGTMCHGIGTLRNDTAHGKDEGYVPQTPEIAQTLNHLAGVVSVFAMKQTELTLKAQ
ncbi:abortive infection family protein [Pseudomonas veronii]